MRGCLSTGSLSQHAVLLQHVLQSLGVEQGVIGDLVDDVGEVCKQVALVLVCENGWYTSVVELNVGVVYAHEVDGRVGWDKRCERI